MIDSREPILPLFDDEEASISVRTEAELHDVAKTSDARHSSASPRVKACPEPTRTSVKRAGGRPKSKDPKVPISIRLDRDVVEKFRATGPGWQSRINAALRRVQP